MSGQRWDRPRLLPELPRRLLGIFSKRAPQATLPKKPWARSAAGRAGPTTLALATVYFALLVIIPLTTVIVATAAGGWPAFRAAIATPRALASYQLTFGASLIASLVNGVFGVLAAWVLVRYRFPGRAVVDALIDLPFALPTAVAGITLATLYAPQGWIGEHLARFGIPGSFSRLGVVVALIFVGLPFVVRTVEPVLRALSPDVEEAATTLGASAFQTFRRVVFPHILPAAITGTALAFARAIGEYGSVVFIAGNIPLKTEITPLLIVAKLEQYDYQGANALAFVMLAVSFALLFGINVLQRWALPASRSGP